MEGSDQNRATVFENNII